MANEQDILDWINREFDTDYKDVDEIPERTLLEVLHQLLLVSTGATVFICNPSEVPG